jgi:hypothetical protein
MQTRRYDILREPTGDAYRALVSLLETSGAVAGLVMSQDGVETGGLALAVVDALKSVLVDVQHVTEWPGTELHEGRRARLVRFEIAPASIELLRTRTDRLYGWRLPHLPEDLCAWRADGSLLLGTIAHERDGWLELADDEVERLHGFVELSPSRR